MNPKPSICPHCGYFFDSATHPKDGSLRPEPGDLSMCLSCGGMLTFTDDMALRAASDEEVESLDSDTKQLVQKMKLARAQVVPLSGLAARLSKH